MLIINLREIKSQKSLIVSSFLFLIICFLTKSLSACKPVAKNTNQKKLKWKIVARKHKIFIFRLHF
jgi:hypothetical protein